MISSSVDSSGPRPFRRFLLTTGGLLFFVIAIVGVWMPGIPTTGPLILASMLLGKANPELRERILALKVFAPYRGYVDGSKPFTKAARFWALGCMWVSIAVSCGIISSTAGTTSIAIPMCLIGGLIGSFLIFWYNPKQQTVLAAADVAGPKVLAETPIRWRFEVPTTTETWFSSRTQRSGAQRIENVSR